MNAFESLISFLASNANMFFLVAIGAMFASIAVGRKSLRAARIIALISLCACAPLFLLYGAATIYSPDIMMLALTAMWGYSTWNSWNIWRRTRPSKPSSPPIRRN